MTTTLRLRGTSRVGHNVCGPTLGNQAVASGVLLSEDAHSRPPVHSGALVSGSSSEGLGSPFDAVARCPYPGGRWSEVLQARGQSCGCSCPRPNTQES